MSWLDLSVAIAASPSSNYSTMTTLRFNFSHPFKGNAVIKMPGTALCIHLLLDSKQSDLLYIPLTGFRTGKYEITPDWEVDNRFLNHQEEFEINNKSKFAAATS